MHIALYIFLSLTIIGNFCRVYNVGTDRSMPDGLRFMIVCWYVFCLMFATILITAFACQ